jgi:hypothetical protein
MRTFTTPLHGYCASCDGLLIDRPVYRMDEAYCCLGCAEGGPCFCTYEADLNSDGVDHLGLPFPMTPVVAATPAPAADRAGEEVAVR